MSSPFGWDLLLDLYECDPDIIKSRDKLVEYVAQVCDRIQMKRYGEPLIEHFGYDKPEAVGYSLVQLIETSAIVGHFSEMLCSAYLDLFSCKQFDADEVARFTADFFGARRMERRLIVRQ